MTESPASTLTITTLTYRSTNSSRCAPRLPGCSVTSPGTSASKPSNGSCTRPTTSSPAGNGSQLPAAAGRTLRPPTPQRPGPGGRQNHRRQTHRAVPLHPQRRALPNGAGLFHPPGRRPGRSPGPADRSPATKSTPPPCKPWPKSASTSPASSPNPGPTKSCKPPTSSSPWAAATPAPSSPANATKNWALPDPAGQSVDAVRPIRDDIEERVRRLLDELGITPVV